MDNINPGKRSRDQYEDDGGTHDSEFGAKKQHIDPTAELILNICKDIRRIGENANLANQIDDISYISNPIVAEFEKIDKLRVSILDTMYAIIIEQPQKITSLSVLVLLCNAKNFLVSKYVIEFFHSKAQKLLDEIGQEPAEEFDGGKSQRTDVPQEDAGIFNNIKSILKFLACMAPIIENYSVVNVFKQFVTLAVSVQNESERRNGIAEEIYFNTLISIPYLMCNDSSLKMIDHCNGLLEEAAKFQIRDKTVPITLLQPFDSKFDNFNVPYVPEKMINLIYPALEKLQGPEKDWTNLKDKLFLNYREAIDPIIENALKTNTISNEIVRHPLPLFSIPSVEKLQDYKPEGSIDTLWHKSSRYLFEVYNTTTDFETVPAIDTYHGLLFKDLGFDILTNLSFNKNEASIQLSILDLYFAKNLFAPPGSSIDQLTMINNDNVSGENDPPLSTWKIEDIAVESILTMIFQLPNPLHHEIYYYTVLISCCRESPESIAPVFGRAIRFFYNNLETLDYELKIRYLDWMSIQLSNFEFSWKWDEWVSDSKKYEKLRYHPKKNFIKNLIAKEIRLSNKNRIKESFVTINNDPNSSDNLLLLDEFYKYLNISLLPNESKYIIDYDSELYGENSEYKEIIAKLEYERKEKVLNNSNISPQEELVHIFSNSNLPLHEVSTKVYDFVIASLKPDEEFHELYNSIKVQLEEYPEINSDKFLINLFYQTYAYIGSRSIYSVVSLLSRDIKKLKFLSGVNEDGDKNQDDTKFKFPELELSEQEFDNRQRWIVSSILRIWIHQPQVAFLILEYLIEFAILKPRYLIEKALDNSYNLIIENISCMESINRVLTNESSTANFRQILIKLYESIVTNINSAVSSLNLDDSNDKIEIIKEPAEQDQEDPESITRIDNQWLIFEYKGLLKCYLRKFRDYNLQYVDDLTSIFENITNGLIKDDVLTWIKELS